MPLLVVESAAKAKTISGYLAKIPELRALGRFEVVASLGHVVDLPKGAMGVDTDTWNLELAPIPDKAKVVAKIRKAADAAAKAGGAVYLAADPDREGEAIAANLWNLLGPEAKAAARRVVFHEITPRALRDAILNPRDVDRNLVDAQMARRALDRVVGYELSPLLWRRFASPGLSAGRVQSAALAMVVGRTAEVRSAAERATAGEGRQWTLHGRFAGADAGAGAGAGAVEARVKEPFMDPDVLEGLMESPPRGWIGTGTQRESKRNPPAPFTTSALQQEAYHRLGIPAKATMSYAQALYEAGHITYMRTDSVALAPEAQAALLAVVEERFGAAYRCARTYSARSAHAQEAHEAIRPTHPEHGPVLPPRDGDAAWSQSHVRLYELIWRRSVASQMIAARYQEHTLALVPDADALGADALGAGWSADGPVFEGTHRVLIEPGYLKAERAAEAGAGADAGAGAGGAGGGRYTCEGLDAKGDVAHPRPLFQEPGLIQAMEEDGIGRPSTYASILDKLYDRGYIRAGENPTPEIQVVHYTWEPEEGLSTQEGTVRIGGTGARLIPTSLGERVIEYLGGVVPSMLDAGFTAQMEADLDRIANGEAARVEVLARFYGGFQNEVQAAAEARTAAAGAKRAPRPRQALREFPEHGVSMIQTRYGPALLRDGTSPPAWVGGVQIMADWRQKAVEALAADDIGFLVSLPKPVFPGSPWKLVMGRYGLYLAKDAKSLHLPKEHWDAAIRGPLPAALVEELERNPPPWGVWESGPARSNGGGRGGQRKSLRKGQRV